VAEIPSCIISRIACGTPNLSKKKKLSQGLVIINKEGKKGGGCHRRSMQNKGGSCLNDVIAGYHYWNGRTVQTPSLNQTIDDR
jgi:hypothetical protein